MLPLTKGGAKELLPVGGEPILGHVLRECSASGITDALVVVAPDKRELETYVDETAGRDGMPARIACAIQPIPRGLADAIRCGWAFTEGEPVAVALPDNLFVDTAIPALAQVIETYQRTETNVIGLTEIFAADAGRRGATPIYRGTRHDDDFVLERIPNKGSHAGRFDTAGMPSAMTGVGRYVFMPDAFTAIDAVDHTLSLTTPSTSAAIPELDDVPMLQLLLSQHRLLGRVLRGTFLDVGIPEGYQEANARVQPQIQH